MPPAKSVPMVTAQTLLGQAGPISRTQLRNLSVIQGVQSVVPIPLYDTLAAVNGNASVSFAFFQQTRGQVGINNSNMEAQGQLISGKVQVVTEIRLDVTQIAPASTYLADLMQFTHGSGAFTLYINNVEYAQGFIKDLIGGGLFGFGTNPVIGGANVPYATARCGSGKGYELTPPLVIPTQTQFALVFNYPAGAPPNPTDTTLLRAMLLGQQIRLMSA